MIDRRCVFEIHRLKDAGYSARQIARELKLGRKTVRKYLVHPEQTVLPREPRASKLDPYREMIETFLAQAPDVKTPVVLQRLRKEGFEGGATIVRSHLQKKREEGRKREAFIRFESVAGRQLQIDWGHFGSPELWDSRKKTLRPGHHRSLQPDALRRIYPQPETGSPAPGIDQCLPVF